MPGLLPRIHWQAGDIERRHALEELARRLLANDPRIEVVHEKPGRRRIATGTLTSGQRCLLKHYFADAARTTTKRLLARLGASTAAREFANLRRLQRRGVTVPAPLGYLRSDTGDEVLVLPFLAGVPLPEALEVCSDRRSLLREVGELVAQLHASRTVHRDLHAQNLWVSDDGPVLLDLQEALPVSPRFYRWRDRGELDASLSGRLSLSEKVSLRMAMLGIERPLSAHDKRRIRRVAIASAQRRRAHVVSRTRRSLAPGRLYTELAWGPARGMRLRDSDETQLQRSLAGESPHDVLRFTPASPHELDVWRREGSPAKHAWVASHGLRARGIPAPSAIAFTEESATGVSTLVLAKATGKSDEIAPLDAYIDLALAMRCEGVVHRSLSQERRVCIDGRPGIERLQDVRFTGLEPSTPEADTRLDAFVETAIEKNSALSAAAAERTRRRYAIRKAFQVLPSDRAAGLGHG